MSTYTVTTTAPRELAGKIAADLRQLALHYHQPPAEKVRDYLQELEILLRGGYVGTYAFGFVRNHAWVLCYEYTVTSGVITGGHAGGIRPDVDIRGASYLNYLTYSDSFARLPETQRQAILSSLPVRRTEMDQPALTPGGAWTVERTYGAGGIEIRRQVYRS
jgi:Bacterial HORMA domain family 1